MNLVLNFKEPENCKYPMKIRQMNEIKPMLTNIMRQNQRKNHITTEMIKDLDYKKNNFTNKSSFDKMRKEWIQQLHSSTVIDERKITSV